MFAPEICLKVPEIVGVGGPTGPFCNLALAIAAKFCRLVITPCNAQFVTSLILNVTFDCLSTESMSRFWSDVTGWPAKMVEAPDNPYWVVEAVDGVCTRLVFVNVREEKHVKNRLHLDLLPRDTTQEAELDRLESLGARIVDDRRSIDPGGWIVMADLEGNEFCLESNDF